jgi:hypothetical protein
MSASQERQSGHSSDESRLSPSPGPDLSGNEALKEPQVEKPAPDPSPRNIHGVKVSTDHCHTADPRKFANS